MKAKLSQSPQARWARKQVKRGNCARCGEKRNCYKQLCDFHQGQFTTYMRERRARIKRDNQRDVGPSNQNAAFTLR